MIFAIGYSDDDKEDVVDFYKMEQYLICSRADVCKRECDHREPHIWDNMCALVLCHDEKVKCVGCLTITKEEEKICEDISNALVSIIVNHP